MSVLPIPAPILHIINQLFELERKLKRLDDPGTTLRNLNRIRQALEEMGYHYHDPSGEAYDLTRTDCEASIAGTRSESLIITEVIKPVVYFRQEGENTIVQRAVVIVS